MDVSHMREVLVLSEHLNYTTAAAKLYVSQPTLTRHVNSVEEALGVKLFKRTNHVVELTQNTREVNARFFESLDDVPTHAVTMGIKSIMHARKLILIALGEAKADAIKAAVEGRVDPACPASVLQLHPDVTFFCDEGAASKLTL